MVMKKLIFLLMILSIFTLVACDNQSSDDPVSMGPDTQPTGNVNTPENNNTQTDTPSDNSDINDVDEPSSIPDTFAYEIDGVVIEMNQNILYVIENVGEPLGIFEAPSCAFEGIDRVFAYPGVQIYTYPVGDDDFIHTITFFDDTIRTPEGRIRLGSSVQDVIDAYGEDFEDVSGVYTYRRGMTRIEFLIDNGIVMGISYGYQLDL